MMDFFAGAGLAELLIAGFVALVLGVSVVGGYVLFRIRESLLRTEKMLRSSAAHARDALFFYDIENKLVYSNAVATQFLLDSRLSAGDIETQERIVALLQQNETGPGEHICETQGDFLLSEDPQLFRGSLRLNDIPYSSLVWEVKGTGSIAAIHDLRAENEQRAKLSRLQYEGNILSKALQASQSGFIVGDAKQDYTSTIYVNQKFSELTKIEPSNALGQPMGKVLAEAFPEQALQQEIARALDQRRPGKIDVQLEEGESEAWYNVFIQPTLDEEGRPDKIVGIISDVTSAKMHESHFFQGQKLEALGLLAGGVAHDFNNILSIIDGHARIAKKKIEPGSELENHLERMMKSVQRGSALTRQLLMFGRHNAIVESVTDLGALVNEQRELLEPILGTSVNLVIQTDDEVCVDYAAESLSQLLVNLAVNAFDAMPDGGTLSIQVDKRDCDTLPFKVPQEHEGKAYGCLSVMDTGVGMDAETKAKIFDPFFTTKDQGKGTGLGLSMVYGMVQQMGGTIQVNSTPDEGTTFYVYFPISDKRPVRKAVEFGGDVSKIRFDGYTALIAEDESDLLTLIAGMLEEMGMEVIVAANGNEALAKQDEYEGNIDFLLTDVVMPKLNGVRLAELFEELRPKSQTVFMSGYPANGQLSRIEIPDGAYLIPKPVQYEKLACILHALAVNKDKKSQDDLRKYAGRWEVSKRKTV